jgi:hypothetical protein
VDANVLYAFTRSRDRMSLVNFPAQANLEHPPLDGTLENRALSASFFEVPHRVQSSVTIRLPNQVDLSLLYAGASGTRFTHVITGDPNADGIGRAGSFTPDIMYVPRYSAPDGDISLVQLDSTGRRYIPASVDEYQLLEDWIEAQSCLRRQRGRIMARNSCGNPWFGTLNARIAKQIPTASGQTVELMADVYNVLNLVNRRWGLFRSTAITPASPVMTIRGYDAQAQRGIYSLNPLPALNDTRDLEGRWSRWLIELGVKYNFQR